MTDTARLTVDALANEIRRLGGTSVLGCGALAEALMPFLSALPVSREAVAPGVEKQISAAIFDPGAEVGMKHDRSLTSWQTDAVMNVLTRLVLDELDASKARIAEGWQPIETAPKNGDIVDLFVSGARRTDCRWNIAGHFWERFPSGQFAFGEDEEPTHWRAPPPHPQTGVKHLPLLQRIARERP
jgi:hypothetical protein